MSEQLVTKSRWRRWVVAILKFAFLAIVLAFVTQTFRDGLRDLAQHRLTLNLPYLFIACGSYFVAQLTMGLFWRRVLAAIGRPEPVGSALANYFISQPGKYVPGKASVILIRAARLHANAKRLSGGAANYKSSLVAAGASSFYETLCYMAVGSILAAGLIPWVEGTNELRWLTPVSLALAAICLTPAAPPVFRWLLGRFTAASGRAELRDRLRQSLGYDLAARGVLSAAVAWTLMSVYLWLIAAAIGMAAGRGFADPSFGTLAFWALATTLPNVAGFASLLPAGIGVREAVSLAVLAPALGDGGAVAVTAASRLVGVATEVIVCVSLLVGETLQKRRHNRTQTAPNRDAT